MDAKLHLLRAKLSAMGYELPMAKPNSPVLEMPFPKLPRSALGHCSYCDKELYSEVEASGIQPTCWPCANRLRRGKSPIK